MNSAHTVGSKYQATKSLRTAEIAKLIRADIKAAIASGELPKGTKVSVTSESFSGGSAIRLAVMACPVQIWTDAFIGSDPNVFFEEDRFTAEAQAVTAALEAIHGAYNFDDSDIQSDYSHVRYYGGAGFASSLTVADRQRTAARLADAALEAREAAARAEDAAAPVTFTAEQAAACGCY